MAKRFSATQRAAMVKAGGQSAAMMVKGITAETKAGLRALITKSVAEGIPTHDIGGLVKNMVGLSAPQARALVSYRQSLVDLGHSNERVTTLTNRYGAKLLRQRADTIARTMVMAQLEAGARAARKQAQDEGRISRRAKVEWVAFPGCCKICAALHGVRVLLGMSFPNGAGLGPPRHPNCRCTTKLVTSTE